MVPPRSNRSTSLLRARLTSVNSLSFIPRFLSKKVFSRRILDDVDFIFYICYYLLWGGVYKYINKSVSRFKYVVIPPPLWVNLSSMFRVIFVTYSLLLCILITFLFPVTLYNFCRNCFCLFFIEDQCKERCIDLLEPLVKGLDILLSQPIPLVIPREGWH